ncbi:MAG: hypothetical protein RL660_1599 [Bacteroidota bacterium]|jgi:signal transduction histidine kinase
MASQSNRISFYVYVILACICAALAATSIQQRIVPSYNISKLVSIEQGRFNEFNKQLQDASFINKTLQSALSRQADGSAKFGYLCEVFKDSTLVYTNTDRILPVCSADDTSFVFASTVHHNYVIACKNILYKNVAYTIKYALPLTCNYASEINGVLVSEIKANNEFPRNWKYANTADTSAQSAAVICNGKPVYFINTASAGSKAKTTTTKELLPLLLLLCNAILCYLAAARLAGQKKRLYGLIFIFIAFAAFRVVNYFTTWPIDREALDLFSASHYAYDGYCRSLADLMLNFVWLNVLIAYLYFNTGAVPFAVRSKFIKHCLAIILVSLVFLVAAYVMNATTTLVINSSIAFDVSLFSYFGLREVIGFLSISFGVAGIVGIVTYVNQVLHIRPRLPWYNILLYAIAAALATILVAKQQSQSYAITYVIIAIAVLAYFLFGYLRFTSIPKTPFTVGMLLTCTLVALIVAAINASVQVAKSEVSLKQYSTSILPSRDLSLEQDLVAALDSAQKVQSPNFVSLLENILPSQDDVELKFTSVQKGSAQDSLCQQLISKCEPSPFAQNVFYYPLGFSGIRYIIQSNMYSNNSAYIVGTDDRLKNLRGSRLSGMLATIRPTVQITNNYDVACYSNGSLVFQNASNAFPKTLAIKATIDTSYNLEGTKYQQFASVNDKIGGLDVVVFAAQPIRTRLVLTNFSFLFLFLFGSILATYTLYYLLASKLSYRRFISLLKPDFNFRFSFIIFCAELLGFAVILALSARAFSDRILKTKKELNYQKLSSISKLVDGKQLSTAQYDSVAEILQCSYQIYDSTGKLCYTSFPNLYTSQLFKPILNHDYLYNAKVYNYTYITQDEWLDQLKYLSSYKQITDGSGSQSILHLPNFNFYEDDDYSLANFFAISVGIFIGVFIVTLLLSYLVAHYLFSKLRILGDDMKSFDLKLGSQHVITWPYQDEIGILVSQYNVMLQNVQKSADTIVGQQKDLAWREMAKQVAHEIKNPITPIKLNLQRLLLSIDRGDADITAKTKQACIGILQQIEQLSTIAGTFSEYANLPPLVASNFDLNELVQDIVLLNEEPNERIKVQYAKATTSIIIFQDKIQIQRIVNNLVSNAIQAIPADAVGNVMVEVFSDQDSAYVRVTDNGIGIAEDKRTQIFKPYFTTKTSGTGLGLVMCKELSIKMGGDIDFSSEEGKGSIFTLRVARNYHV